MSEKKIISGDQSEFRPKGSVIGADGTNPGYKIEEDKSSLTDRITYCTETGGLNKLPDHFDDKSGDWNVINSNDPFQVLFLDYKQYAFITSEMVENNYSILSTFWKDKIGIMNTGGNRVAFRNKFGEGTVETSISKLTHAYERLKTDEGRRNYFLELNTVRLNNGEAFLDPIFNMMIRDGEASPNEIEHIIKEGLKCDLTESEIAGIIKNKIDTNGLKPYGSMVDGGTKDQLLSVSWMTPDKIASRIREDEERKKRGREIFENLYAYDIDDIGRILFENEGLAKDYISKGLITNSIDYFSSARASKIIDIFQTEKNENLRYLKIIYKLNKSLPYKFNNKKFENLKDLSIELFATPKLAKEHIKQGNLEVWLKEADPESYILFSSIRDSAKNIHLAYLELIYRVNPSLPYRFKDKTLVNTPIELFREIDKNIDSWSSAKKELFDESIPTWLRTTGQIDLFNKWEDIKHLYSNSKDSGVEELLHLLNANAEYGHLSADQENISYSAIQSGNIVITDIVFTNKTRGFIIGESHLTKPIDGVSLSTTNFSQNSVTGSTSFTIRLSIESLLLLKGITHETEIVLNVANTGQEIIIPISFKIVFPTQSFVIETIKYAAILAGFLASTRGLIATKYPDWIDVEFDSYLSSSLATSPPDALSFFGWPFLYFVTLIILGLYYFIKYLIKSKFNSPIK